MPLVAAVVDWVVGEGLEWGEVEGELVGEGVGVSGVVNLHIITQFSKRFVFIHRFFNGY